MSYRSINFEDKFGLFQEQWLPKVIAEMNDYQFKVVKLQGDFIWHDHKDTDEVICGSIFAMARSMFRRARCSSFPRVLSTNLTQNTRSNYCLLNRAGCSTRGMRAVNGLPRMMCGFDQDEFQGSCDRSEILRRNRGGPQGPPRRSVNTYGHGLWSWMLPPSRVPPAW
jgi:hypothetical protein